MVQKKMHPKKTLTTKTVLEHAPKYIGGITAGLYIIAIITLLIAGVLPVIYALILAVLGGFGLWLVIKPLFGKKLTRKKGVALSLLALLISVISIALISFSISLISFLHGIQEDEYSTETYSIIAEKDRSMTTEKAATAGLVQTDPYLKESAKELKNHTKATAEERPTTAAVMTDLESDTLDTAVLNSANTQLAEDSYTDFNDKFEVIGTFTIKVKRASTAVKAADTSKPFALYISGIDTYGAISSVSRSDVNILAIVNPQTNQLLLVNTPRDYYVQLHGTTGTKDKLTHAGVYGVDMSRQTLEDLYNVEIPYYLRVNFSSLVTIVDAVGGINVYSDHAFKSFQAGYNQLNGKQALEFSRERYSFSEGDRQRGRNQQRVIEAIVSKMSTPGALVNYQSVLNSVQGAVQTNLPPSFITGLAQKQIGEARGWATQSISVDGSGSMGPTYSMGAQPLYIMIPNEASVEQAKATIQQHLKATRKQ